MSISSEITRISGNVSDALTAIANKGVTVPSGSNSDDLATLIAQISSGGTGAITITDTTDSHGGTIREITGIDISDTTATASDVASGKYFYTAAGTKTQGSHVDPTSKAVYTYKGLASRTANSYGATSASVTVTKAGTYTISYVAIRGSSSGTMGTNLYIGSSSGTNNTTWNNGTYGQAVTLTGQTIAANTTVTIYATSGNTSRTIYVGQLIVEEE